MMDQGRWKVHTACYHSFQENSWRGGCVISTRWWLDDGKWVVSQRPNSLTEFLKSDQNTIEIRIWQTVYSQELSN
jgi:hypothetical protein